MTAAGSRRGRTRAVVLAASCAVVLASACTRVAQSHWLEEYEGRASAATRALEAAGDDTARAHALSDRGRAYSERARYSRTMKLVDAPEYERLYGVALADHDRAVALAPADARSHLARGLTQFDRAMLEDGAAPVRASLLEAAAAECSRALEADPANVDALDTRGLVHGARREYDDAIKDFGEVARRDPKHGASRLVSAYCGRARAALEARNGAAAIADFEKAATYAADAAQDCDCQPETSLVALYTEAGDYARAWDAVSRAGRAHHAVDPEALAALQKASGRAQ